MKRAVRPIVALIALSSGCLTDEEPVTSEEANELSVSYPSTNYGVVSIFKRSSTVMSVTWAPVCSGTALSNGNASASNMILTSKHCVTSLMQVGATIGTISGSSTTAKSNWLEYDITSQLAGLCVQIDGQQATGCAVTGAAAASATTTPAAASRVYKIWAPADQNADWAIIQTYAPLATTPQVLAHGWGWNGTKWVSQSGKDVTWTSMQGGTSTFAMGFQKREPSLQFSASNPDDLKYSYMSFATGTDPASFTYSYYMLGDYLERGYATYLKPAPNHLNASDHNGGGSVFSFGFTSSGYGSAPRYSAITGVMNMTTFPLSIEVNGSTIEASLPQLTSANAVTTSGATSQEIVQWLNTAPGPAYHDFCSMHGWYHSYTCDTNGVAASIAGLGGTTYTTYNPTGPGIVVNLADTTGGSSVSTLKQHVQNYWWTGTGYAYWFTGSFSQGASSYSWLDPTVVSSPASTRDFSRNVKSNAFIDRPEISSSGGVSTFVEANTGLPVGNNLGNAPGLWTWNDALATYQETGNSVSFLGQSCDARDGNGKPCSAWPDNTLTCARTQDAGWGGRGKNYGSNAASYRCVYADPVYYAHMDRRCWDVWRGRTPDASPSATESFTALMYLVNPNNPSHTPTAAGTWERACLVGR